MKLRILGYWRLAVLLSFGLILVCSGCAGGLRTGHSHIVLVNDDELRVLGSVSYGDVLSQSELSKDAPLVARVKAVAARLVEAAGSSDPAWECNVIADDQTAHAFCLPGGKIAVYTGMLPYTRNEEGLAALISHELAHAMARHSAERVSQILAAQVGEAAVGAVLKEDAGLAVEAVNQAYGAGMGIGCILPFSLPEELDADRAGMGLMARAGYDPREAVAFWKRLSHTDPVKIPVYLSIHPAEEGRMRKMEAYLPDVLRDFKQRLD